MSKCHIVGNHMSQFICVLQEVEYYTDKDGSYACKPSRRNGSPRCELVSNINVAIICIASIGPKHVLLM